MQVVLMLASLRAGLGRLLGTRWIVGLWGSSYKHTPHQISDLYCNRADNKYHHHRLPCTHGDDASNGHARGRLPHMGPARLAVLMLLAVQTAQLLFKNNSPFYKINEDVVIKD